MRIRNKRIHIYLTEEELNKLTQKQKQAGLSREEFCRRVLNDVEIKQGPSLDTAMLIKELNRIGSNINQIAAKANSLGFVDTPKLTYELDKLDDIERIIVKAFAMEK